MTAPAQDVVTNLGINIAVLGVCGVLLRNDLQVRGKGGEQRGRGRGRGREGEGGFGVPKAQARQGQHSLICATSATCFSRA